MIVVLDSSAAIKLAMADENQQLAFDLIRNAEWVVAPEIFLAEVANVSWKYYQFEKVALSECEQLLKLASNLVDELIDSAPMIDEVFNLSCKTRHPVHDALYLVTARRYNGSLLTYDKKLKQLAKKISVKVAS